MQKLFAHDTWSDLEQRIIEFIFESDDQKEKEACFFSVVGSKKKSKEIWFKFILLVVC